MRFARLRRRWLGPLVSFLAVLVAYYAWPVNERGAGLAAGLLLTLIAVGALAWAIAVQVRHHLLQDEHVGLPSLAMLLGMVLVVFAFGYYRLEIVDPDQMAGLRTKTDSLYFTLQILTTVGLGDVHATGQLARQLAMVQMVFDLVFVAAAGSLVAGKVKEGIRPKQDPGAGARRAE